MARSIEPRVTRVLYPRLADFSGHALAKEQMHGFGGMLTIEVTGDRDDATQVADRLRVLPWRPVSAVSKVWSHSPARLRTMY